MREAFKRGDRQDTGDEREEETGGMKESEARGWKKEDLLRLQGRAA